MTLQGPKTNQCLFICTFLLSLESHDANFVLHKIPSFSFHVVLKCHATLWLPVVGEMAVEFLEQPPLTSALSASSEHIQLCVYRSSSVSVVGLQCGR